jgi:hypothetical protein
VRLSFLSVLPNGPAHRRRVATYGAADVRISFCLFCYDNDLAIRQCPAQWLRLFVWQFTDQCLHCQVQVCNHFWNGRICDSLTYLRLWRSRDACSDRAMISATRRRNVL